jgi:hypothetical protein
MAKFLTGDGLNSELKNIFEEANKRLVLISPYIKLHARLVSVLKTKRQNPWLQILVVFGKNDDKSRSMTEQDFEILTSLPNIKIFFEKNLHAKYYANESSAIITSMNLYDYSQNHNIEAGVLIKTPLLQGLANKALSNVTGSEQVDVAAATYFDTVIEQAELVYHNEPEFESVLLGFQQKYNGSTIRKDKLSNFFSQKSTTNSTIKSGTDNTRGYCIRTGKPIVFNINNPFCEEALTSWKKFGNKDYPEKFCHFSGEASNGLTSFSKPILPKNWAIASQVHSLK